MPEWLSSTPPVRERRSYPLVCGARLGGRHERGLQQTLTGLGIERTEPLALRGVETDQSVAAAITDSQCGSTGDGALGSGRKTALSALSAADRSGVESVTGGRGSLETDMVACKAAQTGPG